MSLQDAPENYAPYFANSADYQYKLVDPDSKKFYNELNKDVATSNLNNAEIAYLNLAEIILGYLYEIGATKAISSFKRDMLGLVNFAKARRGFFLGKVTGIGIKLEKYGDKEKRIGFK